ncbi:hypothetical protein GCM10009527_007510 [Actinomadura nitritigenes]
MTGGRVPRVRFGRRRQRDSNPDPAAPRHWSRREDLPHAVDEFSARIADASTVGRLDLGEGVFDVGRYFSVRQPLPQGAEDAVDRHVWISLNADSTASRSIGSNLR